MIREIYDWSAAGIGVYTIVRRLQERGTPGAWGKTWSLNGVRSILRNEAYLGKLIWGRTSQARSPARRSASRRPFLVTSGRARTCRSCGSSAMTSGNASGNAQNGAAAKAGGRRLSAGRPPNSASRHILSGFMTCAVCGKAIVTVHQDKIYGPRWGCYGGHRAHSCSNTVEVGWQASSAWSPCAIAGGTALAGGARLHRGPNERRAEGEGCRGGRHQGTGAAAGTRAEEAAEPGARPRGGAAVRGRDVGGPQPRNGDRGTAASHQPGAADDPAGHHRRPRRARSAPRQPRQPPG